MSTGSSSLDEGHAGKAYTLDGPELVSHREQVQAIAAAIGEPVRFEAVEPRVVREYYLAQGGFAADNADFLLGFEDYSGAGSGEQEEAAWAQEPVPTSQEATGRPARTFAQWARDHADDFR